VTIDSLLLRALVVFAPLVAVGCADLEEPTEPAAVSTALAVTSVPGRWRLVYHSDMSSLSGWSVFDNPSRSDSQGPRLASNVEQVNHATWREPHFVRLHSRLSTDARMDPDTRWASSGIALYGQTRTFGRFDARIRSNRSFGTRNVALLWPTGTWPCSGEIDFYEVSAREPLRDRYHYSNHYCDRGGRNAQDMATITPPAGVADFTDWQTFTLVWRAREEILYIDGVEKARFTEHIPQGPMWLGFQTAMGTLAQGQTWTASTFDVADVAIYEEY
jgi:hypothetical protein